MKLHHMEIVIMSNISQTAVYESNDYNNHYFRHTFIEYKPQKRIIKFGSRFCNEKYYLEFPYVQFVLKESNIGEQTFYATASQEPFDLSSKYASLLPMANVNSASKVCLNMPIVGKIEECVTHFWNSIFNQDITSSIRTAIRAYIKKEGKLFYEKNFDFYAYMGDLAAPAPYYFENWQKHGFPYELLSCHKCETPLPSPMPTTIIVDETAKKFFDMNAIQRGKILQQFSDHKENLNVLFFRHKTALYSAINNAKNN